MISPSNIVRNLASLTAFSLAMGFLEAVVVVYLRQLCYPGGFAFPLKPMADEILTLESFREISTVVILVVAGMITGRTAYERFSYFLYCFGLWDIFYYVWLKVLLNWPPSLLTWDILFLIPVVWVGPVLAPIICAGTMVVYSLMILYFQNGGYPIRITRQAWIMMYLGFFIIFITFVSDYSGLMIQAGFPGKMTSWTTDPHFQRIIEGYIPASFNWTLFILGESLILCSLVIFVETTKSSRHPAEPR
jgi:hypothetical protein